MADVNDKQFEIEQTNTEQAELEKAGQSEQNAAGQDLAGQTGQGTPGQDAAGKPKPRGSFFERRYKLYDHIKLSVKTLDIIIAVAVIFLFVTFILGIYKR